MLLRIGAKYVSILCPPGAFFFDFAFWLQEIDKQDEIDLDDFFAHVEKSKVMVSSDIKLVKASLIDFTGQQTNPELLESVIDAIKQEIQIPEYSDLGRFPLLMRDKKNKLVLDRSPASYEFYQSTTMAGDLLASFFIAFGETSMRMWYEIPLKDAMASFNSYQQKSVLADRDVRVWMKNHDKREQNASILKRLMTAPGAVQSITKDDTNIIDTNVIKKFFEVYEPKEKYVQAEQN